jgi:hypothetical protein
MSETEILRHIRSAYGAMIAEAAARNRHRPEVMAGIVMRETQGGLSPLLDRQGPEGRGPDWKDAAKNIDMGAWVLGRKRAFLAARTLGFKLTDDDLEKASIAAYNAGEGWVLKAIEQGRDPDSCAAHGDYAAGVLRYANLYLNLEA